MILRLVTIPIIYVWLSISQAQGPTCTEQEPCKHKYDTVINFFVDEPNDNTDGTPLTDLDSLILFYQYENSGQIIEALQKPASSPTGGAVQVSLPNINPGAPLGAESKIRFWVIAVSTGQNKSDPSNIVVIIFDGIRPAAPSGTQSE